MKPALLWFLLVLIGAPAWAQVANERTVAYVQAPSATSLRIDQGKVWLNGKQLPAAELPPSLQKLDKAIYYEAKVSGVSEFTFNIGEQQYLVQADKISEVQVAEGDLSPYAYDSKQATEAYYSQLKRESPNLFYGLSREGVLLEQVRQLLHDYERAKSKDKPGIRTELRKVLSQLYDINERNKELEIAELEAMIEAAKQEVEYRKAHKAEIIERSLEELLRR